jgi:hypothetical protein
MGPRARGMSVVSTALGRRSPRRNTRVGVLVLATFTSEQTLYEGLQNCHFCHFTARPTRPPGAGTQSASRSMRSRSDLRRVFLGAQIPRAYRCTESAIPISAPCSLSRATVPFADFGHHPCLLGVVSSGRTGRVTTQSPDLPSTEPVT